MGKVGWFVAACIIIMVIGLVMMGDYQEGQITDRTGCHYEYKLKNNKRVRVLDCD
jgi:hypothetical protein